MDFNAHLGAVTRTVNQLERDGKPARGVTLERTYATSVADAGEGRARLTLCHIALVDEHYWPTYGPGAGGVGWDLALAGLESFLVAPTAARFDETLLATTPEGRRFVAGLSEDWGRAAMAGGEDPAWARAAAARTTAFYMGEEEPGA